MPYATIDLTVRDGVAHLTLNRPAAANSITLELARDLMYATLQCDEDPAVRAVLLASSRSAMVSARRERLRGRGATPPSAPTTSYTELETRLNARAISRSV